MSPAGTTRVTWPRNSLAAETASGLHVRRACTAGCPAISGERVIASALRRSGVPVQRPLLPRVDVACQQNQDVEKHLNKAEHAQVAEDDRPGKQEDRLHIEEN